MSCEAFLEEYEQAQQRWQSLHDRVAAVIDAVWERDSGDNPDRERWAELLELRDEAWRAQREAARVFIEKASQLHRQES